VISHSFAFSASRRLKFSYKSSLPCTAFPSTLVSMLELSPPLPILLLLCIGGLSRLNTRALHRYGNTNLYSREGHTEKKKVKTTHHTPVRQQIATTSTQGKENRIIPVSKHTDIQYTLITHSCFRSQEEYHAKQEYISPNTGQEIW
jgi:hypothetical protein